MHVTVVRHLSHPKNNTHIGGLEAWAVFAQRFARLRSNEIIAARLEFLP